MTDRRQLQNRRAHELQEFWFKGHNYTLGVGEFDDGGISEIFIDCAKLQSQSANDARDAGVCLSIALQCGVKIEAIRSAVTREEDGSPTGIIGQVLDMLAERRT